VRVRVGDVRLYFDVDGAKLVPDGPWMRHRPTVILLHPGPGFDHTLYKVQLGPALAEYAQVVYVDQRGHGRSDRSTPDRWNVDTWAADVKGLCDAVRIEKPVVLGHGFGALVAARYAASYPDHPGRVVLANPAARLVPARSVAVYDRIGGAEAGEAARQFFEEPSPETFAGFLRHCIPLIARERFEPEITVRADWTADTIIRWYTTEARSIDLRESLAAVKAPTLVMAGADDPQMTVTAAEEVVASLPPELVEYRAYPGARHALFRDHPEALPDLRAFVTAAEEVRP
jgi:pimeloyl-ACP methyl ester carboxylesterase